MIEFNKPKSSPFDDLEVLLRSAADFEPEVAARPDFVHVAMRRGTSCRVAARQMWFVGAVTACTGFLCVMPMLKGGSNPALEIPKPVIAPIQTASTTPKNLNFTSNPTRNSARSDNEESSDSSNSDRLQTAAYHPRSSTRKRVSPPPAVDWQNESVDRYASGVISPVWREVKDEPTGSSRLEQALLTEPLESGEKSHQTGTSPNGMFSLVSYDGGR
ncbi:MAG: hypothetical protein ABJA67_00520 [Chthonomonadales bacterium]